MKRRENSKAGSAGLVKPTVLGSLDAPSLDLAVLATNLQRGSQQAWQAWPFVWLTQVVAQFRVRKAASALLRLTNCGGHSHPSTVA
jgi:hypothetical protein